MRPRGHEMNELQGTSIDTFVARSGESALRQWACHSTFHGCCAQASKVLQASWLCGPKLDS